MADHRSLLSDRRRSGTGRRQRFPASGNYLSALVPRVATWTLAAYCPLASHSLSIRRIELDPPPGVDPEICVGGLPPLPFRPLSFTLVVRSPLNQLGGLRNDVSSPSGGRGGASAENEFGALYSCEKATGGNHLEYSEVHVTSV